MVNLAKTPQLTHNAVSTSPPQSPALPQPPYFAQGHSSRVPAYRHHSSKAYQTIATFIENWFTKPDFIVN